MIDVARLAQMLPEQRWFGAKSRSIRSVDVVDEIVIDDGPPALVLAIAAVRFASGDDELYQLALLVDDEGSRDAADDPERLRLLGELLAGGHVVKGNNGAIYFGGPGLDPSSSPGSQSIRVAAGEQSNTSIVFDEQVILKLFRRLDTGPNPDLELNRFLTSEGFPHIPSQVGEIVYEGTHDDAETRIDLGVAQQFITEGVDAWEEMKRRLHELYDGIAGDEPTTAEAVEERASRSLTAIADLGEVTAGLHVALAREESDPEFAPEPIGPEDLRAWAHSAGASLDALAGGSAGDMEGVEPARAALDSLTTVADAGQKIRVHGDFHLGQVLLAGRGWTILDFEGEPARSLEERRSKQSPLRDVAGMLRSFAYASTAALFDRAEPDSAEWARLEPWGDAWEALARHHFLTAYLTKSHEAHFLPRERDTIAVLVRAFEIDKLVYEIGYEINHRPDWARIPRRGLARLVAETGAR